MRRFLIRLVLTASIGSLLACGDDDRSADPDMGRVVEDPDLGVGPACLAPATPGRALDRCRCGSDCEVGAICDPEESSQVPGGSCGRVCTVDGDCGPSARCAIRTIGRCVPTCTASSDCGEGRYCIGGTCTALCQADSQCESGNCNRSSGLCLAPGVVPTGARTNEACVRDEDCLSTFCIDSLCTTLCARSAQGCPSGEFCYGDDSFIDGGFCYPICSTSADCIDPLAECVDVTDLGLSARVCV